MAEEKVKKELVELAKNSILQRFGKADDEKLRIAENYKEKRGVFVTLTKQGKLRGCIGFIEPIMNLGQAVIQAAQGAAFSDPRFVPLQEKELERVRIEISILTEPKEFKAKPENVESGKDGLICDYKGMRGLLLPQVATELEWDAEEFLSQTCVKAGLAGKTWQDPECKFYKFQVEKISED